MILIERPLTDPYLNIATEEFVLKNINENILMLWQSEPSVIVGKHQNTLAEVNLGFVTTEKIPVIRRISGGGTVYHDAGNINYTLITSEKNRERLIDFRKFLQPVIEFLQTLGITAEFEGKNNLVVGGKKISGNSAHVFKNRVMHHGTLLYSSNLDILDKAIHPEKLNIKDKAVQSVRASVGNVREFIEESITIKEFSVQLQDFMIKYYNIDQHIKLSKDQISEINTLATEKYKTWNWNFGYSPSFSLDNHDGDYSLRLIVKNGQIVEIEFSENFDSHHELKIALTGIEHQSERMKSVLEPLLENKVQLNKILSLSGFIS